MNPRKIAFDLLLEWSKNGTYPNLALKNALRNVKEQRDRRFITALVYGVIERKITLDHWIVQCSSRKVNQITPDTLNALRLGTYQLFYMNIPASAACNTTVQLVKDCGNHRAAGFVNAVLRYTADHAEELLKLKKADFSVRYSINPFLVDLLLEQYGKECFVRMMEEINQPDLSMHLFFNPRRGSAEEFLKTMEAEGVTLAPTALSGLYKTAKGFSVEESAAFKNGWFHVVGPHSAESAMHLPRNAAKVMDLCAAPGGKTFILAALTEGEVHAFDLHTHKTENLVKGAGRLHHENVVVAQADATALMEKHRATADFVLCDVPCSGLGIIRSKPDIKYKEYDTTALLKTQRAILENAAEYLKEGGILVYSTCTIDKRENEEAVRSFLQQHVNFSLTEEKTYLPGIDGDGFYYAILKKGNRIEH